MSNEQHGVPKEKKQRGEEFTESELLERIKRMYEKKKPEDQIIVLTESEYRRQTQNLIEAQMKIYEEEGKIKGKAKLQKEIYELRGKIEMLKKLNEELMKRIKNTDVEKDV